jgi:hypothetical protein
MSCLSVETIDQYLSLSEPVRYAIAKAVPEYRHLHTLSRDEWKRVVFYPGIENRFYGLLQYYAFREKMDLFWLEKLTKEQRDKIRPSIINFLEKNKRCECYEKITGLVTCTHTDIQVMEHIYDLMLEETMPPLERDTDAIVPLLHGISERANIPWFIHVVRSTLNLPMDTKRTDIKDIAAAMVSSEYPINMHQINMLQRLVALKKDSAVWILVEAFPRLTASQKEIVYGIFGVEDLSGITDEVYEKLNSYRRNILIEFIKRI